MTSRVLLFASLLPLSALAQIQIYQFDGATEKSVAATFDVGAATPGDTVESRFRVRNMGNGPAVFQTLSLSGQGFRISAAPFLPYTIAPGFEAEFRVLFSPSVTGSYSASLAVNTINITLRGSSVTAASLMLAGAHNRRGHRFWIGGAGSQPGAGFHTVQLRGNKPHGK
jgi:hypothetical protein